MYTRQGWNPLLSGNFPAVLPQAVLAEWEGEFGHDPRYWELRYFCALAQTYFTMDQSYMWLGSEHEAVATEYLLQARELGIADWNTLCLIGALLLAFGAGWCLGRANPSWELDRGNEDVEYLRRRGHGWGSGWGSSGYSSYAGGCGALGAQFLRGTGLTVVFVLGAVVLAYFGFESEHSAIGGGSTAALIALGVAALTGYIVSRVTDKGPVGPLE